LRSSLEQREGPPGVVSLVPLSLSRSQILPAGYGLATGATGYDDPANFAFSAIAPRFSAGRRDGSRDPGDYVSRGE